MNAGVVAYLCDTSRFAYDELKHLVIEQTKAAMHASLAPQLVRGGSILPAARERIASTFSEHDPAVGRTMTSSTHRTAAERELAIVQHALADCEHLSSGNRLNARFIVFSGAECISVSNCSHSTVRATIDTASQYDWFLGCLLVNGDSACARDYFWNDLVPIAALSGGVHLRNYEDAPESFGRSPCGQLFFRPEYSASPEADGFFTTELSGELVPEERYSGLNLPSVPHWDGGKIPEVPPCALTPAAHVFYSLSTEGVTRISREDDPSRRATVSLAAPRNQFPEPSKVLEKVRRYCLDPRQTERKYLGFSQAGFFLGVNDELLTHLLCSAFYGEFNPKDVRATADGSVQFGLDICLPQPFGGASQCQTAWYIPAGGPILLSTATVAGRCKEADGVTHLPAAVVDNPERPDTLAFIEREATSYGHRVKSSILQAKGWLWIPHSNERNRAFARSVRRFHGGHTSVRRGQRVTQWSLHLGVAGETQVAGTLYRAQNLLGLIGVESRVEIAGD